MAESIPQGYESSADSLTNSQLSARASQLQSFMQSSTIDRITAADQGVRYIGDAISKMMGSRSFGQLMQDPSLANQLGGFGMMMGSAALARRIPGLGVDSDMFRGVQQATTFASGGILDHNTGRLSPTPAYGAMGPTLAAEVTRRLSEHYFPAADNGMPNMSRTMGLSKGDIGDVVAHLGRGGAFAGIPMAEQRMLTAGDISSQRAAALASGDQKLLAQVDQMRPGDFQVKVRDDAAGKVQGMADEAVKAVGWLKKILGDVSGAQMMIEAEQLSGAKFSQPGGADIIRSRLQNVLATGRAAGMSDMGSLNYAASTAATVDQILANRTGQAPGSFADFSAGVSGAVMQQGLAETRTHARLAELARDRGNYYPVRDGTDITASNANAVARITAEDTGFRTAAFVASLPGVSDEHRQALMGAVDAYGTSSGTREGRMKSEANFNRLISAAGFDPFAMSNQVNEASMTSNIGNNPDILKRYTAAALGNAGMRDENIYRGWMSPGGMLAPQPWIKAVGGVDSAVNLAMQMDQIPSSHMAAFTGALDANRGASAADLSTALTASLHGGMPAQQAAALGQTTAAAQVAIRDSSSGAMGLDTVMATMANLRGLDHRMTGISASDRQHQSGVVAGVHDASVRMGEYEPAPNPMLDFTRGLLGYDPRLANEDYRRAIDATAGETGAANLTGLKEDLELDSKGGLKLESDPKKRAEQLKKIADWTRNDKTGMGIMERLGFGKDFDKLGKALSGPDGGALLADYLKSNPDAIYAFGPGKEGGKEGGKDGISIMSKDIAKKMRDDMATAGESATAASKGSHASDAKDLQDKSGKGGDYEGTLKISNGVDLLIEIARRSMGGINE